MAAQRKSANSKTAKSGGATRFGNGFKTLGRKIGGRGRWWVRTIRWFAFLGVLGALSLALTFFILYRAISIPDANADFQTQTTQVYYSDGKHKLGEFSTQDRESIPLDQVPAAMQAAAIAAEDRSFYTNRGIDIKGIVRAVRDNTTSGSIQGGGSTITQQYVKILYLTQERSYTRKVKEAILSIKIHNQLTKEEILEGYLNTIYFGNGAYGVEVASQTYFNKPASKLNYAQSALLATIINSPSFYDPYAEGAKDRIQPRFNYVLAGMAKAGAITQDEAAKFADRIPKVADKKNVNRFSGSKGYLLQLVKDKMVNDLNFDPSEVDGSGLRIVTTFDYEDQQDAIAAIKQFRPADRSELHQALVSVEPGTGAVRAMYAGRDYLKDQLNWATSGTQPGSTFKPFAVVAALENGYSLQTKLDGNSPLRDDRGNVLTTNQGDSGGASFGNVSLATATAKSINTAFVDLTLQMDDGPDKVLDAAQALGVPARILDPIRDGGAPAVTPLGYFPVAPVDMANAYATLAAEGKRADWHVISKVSDYQGDVKYKHKVKTKQAIPKDVAADTIASMVGVIRSGSGTNGRTVCSATAGKTGTATAGKTESQHVSSSWFAGFTPKAATAVMYNRGKLGNGDLEGYMIPFFGGQIPAKTFAAYMNSTLDPSDCGTFPPAANIKADKGTVYVAPKPKKTKKPKPKPTRTTRPAPTTPAPTQTTPAPQPTTPEPTTPEPTPTGPTPDEPDLG